MTDPMWRSLSAVRNGNVYEAPCGPYSSDGRSAVDSAAALDDLARQPDVPDVFDYDIDERVREFYRCSSNTT